MSLTMVLSPVSAQSAGQRFIANTLVAAALIILTTMSLVSLEPDMSSPGNSLSQTEAAMGITAD